MSWKIFKKQIASFDFKDETKFILGIDIGTKETKIAFWNVNRNQAELIDMSGGYGTPSIPTVMQYIPENREWVFGEYALLNRGYFEDVTIHNMISKLGTKELIDISGKPMNIPSLLSRYIKEIIEMCKNINPNGEVVGIVAAIPDYFSEGAKEELGRAFAMAGLDKVLITLMSHRECLLRYLYFDNELSTEENILFIDYGGREFRGGLVRVNLQDECRLKVESLSYLFDASLGVKKLDLLLKEVFINFYCEELGLLRTQLDQNILHQIEIFAYQNKGLLFQNYYKRKSTKLYFNFAYPAFQKTVSIEDMDEWIKPFVTNIKEFITSLLDKTIYGDISKEEVSKVIAVGGGFEMNWMKELLENEFSEGLVIFPKESGGTTAIGACIGAATYLGIIPSKTVELTDKHKLTWDIGIKAVSEEETKFIPLIEKNTFWWQKPKPRIFILDEEGESLDIPIYKRNEQGELILISNITIENIPSRPSRTVRLKLSIELIQYDKIEIQVEDLGFGELFPSMGFVQKFVCVI